MGSWSRVGSSPKLMHRLVQKGGGRSFKHLQETEYNTSMSNTTTATKVHIVFKEAKEAYSGQEFIGVFFDRKSAEEWIAARGGSARFFFIETYEQPAEGMAHEVFA